MNGFEAVTLNSFQGPLVLDLEEIMKKFSTTQEWVLISGVLDNKGRMLK